MIKRTWSWKKVNIGKGWTLLSTECYYKNSCSECIYYRYCRRTDPYYPTLKKVVDGLLERYGEPPQEYYDKLFLEKY